VLVLQLSSPKTPKPKVQRVLVLQLSSPKTLNPRCKQCWLPFFSSRLVSSRLLLGTKLWYMRSVQRRSLSELLLPQKFPELERFFWGKKRTESFLFPFLISKKKNSLFLQLWNHPLESERHTHTESTMMILINWKKKKKKQRPKVEAISLIAQQLLL
jgi:hypothetical protein